MKNVVLSSGRFMAWAWCVCIIALFSVQASAFGGPANPMAKVTEFLGILSKQIEEESKEDEATYKASTKYYEVEKEKSEKTGKAVANKVAQLQADLDELQATQDGKREDYTNLANNLAKNGMELAAGKASRRKEREAFEKNEDVFVESVHRLDKAISTMKLKAPAASASASASLLSVAQRLKTTLTHSADFPLSAAQKEILDSFMRSAETFAFPAPSFLQHESTGPFGEYQAKNPGLLGTLQELLGKVTKQRDDARKVEREAKADFKEFSSALTKRLKSGEKSLTEMKIFIAQSEQQSAQKKGSLADAKEIYEAEAQHLKEVEKEFRDKTQQYKMRLGKRGDEAIAVHEAKRLLTGEIATAYEKIHAGILNLAAREKAAVRRKAIHVMKHATTPGLALLVLKSTARFKSGADPFKKVQTMVKGMLESLQDKQARDATKAGFCQQELGKTSEQMKSKEENMQKLQSRIEAVSADLSEVAVDLATATNDLKEVEVAKADATSIRDHERTIAQKAIKQYKAAAILLRRACKALKSYYAKEEGPKSSKVTKANNREGLASGIIALLEVAIDDFEGLHDDAVESDKVSEKDFREMLKDSGMRSAVFKKDIEWKSAEKRRLELDQSTLTSDSKMNEKEMKTIDSYISKLKASCVISGPSYAEKTAKRAADLESLKEVLAYLKGE